MRLPAGCFGFLAFLFLTAPLPSVRAHVIDDIAFNSAISLNEDDISLCLTVYAGMMFGGFYLEMLDGDKNSVTDGEETAVFSEYVLNRIRLRINGEAVSPVLTKHEVSSVQEFMTGLGTIRMVYRAAYPKGSDSLISLYYENCLEPEAAIYSLSVSRSDDAPYEIIREERNEVLQDLVELDLAPPGTRMLPPSGITENLPAAKPNPSPGKPPLAEPALQETITEQSGTVPGAQRLVSLLKSGDFSVLILLALAVGVGFLHAFAPGHGKSLVGAYLVANEGTLIQAAGLGLVVTMTHTLSIYILGLLSSAAAYVFMPSEIIPAASVFSGVLIIAIALWNGVSRFLGLQTDHAHILPNLRILKSNGVNIILDGSAADAADFLVLESEGEAFREMMDAAGAEGINICSPGCETHRYTPRILAERQSFQLMKLAMETGAVEAVVSKRKSIRTGLERIKNSGPVRIEKDLRNSDEAAALLKSALRNYCRRGEVRIPEKDRLSWQRIVPLGIAGGMVPCPDALAVLIISMSMGRLFLGMQIVLAFSTGLAVALMLIGSTVVLTGRAVSGARRFPSLSRALPWLSTIFLIGLGTLLILTNIS